MTSRKSAFLLLFLTTSSTTRSSQMYWITCEQNPIVARRWGLAWHVVGTLVSCAQIVVVWLHDP